LTLTVAAALAAFALAPTAEAYNPQIAGLQIALRQHGLYGGPIDAVQGRRLCVPCGCFSAGTGSPSTGSRDREHAPPSVRAGAPSSELESSAVAHAVTTSACSSSFSDGTACEPAGSTGASA
jgi:hypothetical protein